MSTNLQEEESSKVLLKLKNIHLTYNHFEHVLKGVSLTLNRNQIVAIKGVSGSGKTSLLNIVGTLLKPDSGDYTFANSEVLTLSDNKRALFRNKNIGFVFQDHRLFQQYTVLENVLLPTLAEKLKANAEEIERAKFLLDKVGVLHHGNKYPNQLSGGECQRVAIARALIMQPQLLLADEPTGLLDEANSDNIVQLISDISAKEQLTTLMVTHSDKVASVANSCLHFENGVLI